MYYFTAGNSSRRHEIYPIAENVELIKISLNKFLNLF
jgi:hypothetical protein